MNDRLNRVSRLLNDRKSRASYVKSKLGVLVPAQIRALRLKSDMPRQSDLARAADMQQSRISKLETPGDANVTLETLSQIAATFKVGLVVKFVPFSEMLRWENRFSQDAFDVTPIDKDVLFLNPKLTSTSGEGYVVQAWDLAIPKKPPTTEPFASGSSSYHSGVFLGATGQSNHPVMMGSEVSCNER